MAMTFTPPTDRETEAPEAETTAEVVRLVRELLAELHPARSRRLRVDADSRLDRDLGLDSLAQAELLLRIERRFDVHLSDEVLGRAETVADLVAAVGDAAGRPVRPSAGRGRPALAPLMEAPETAATLVEVLDWHSQQHPERAHALLLQRGGEARTLTYGELADGVRAVAQGLRVWGLQPGERAALMLPTGVEFFEAFLGVLVAGGIPVPIYPPARPSQLEAHLRRQAGILQNAGAAILIAPPEGRGVAALLRGLVESLRGIEPVAALRDMGEGAGGELPAVRDPAQTALIQYTSGSTGDPKGVVLSHANLLANIRAMGDAMQASSQDVFVSWLPLYHDMGLIGAWLGCLYYGAALAIMPPLTFLAHPAEWLWAIHDVRGTLSAAPNFAFELCLGKVEDKALQGLDLGSLRMVANGAEPVSARTVRHFIERFAAYGFRAEAMAPVYGLAENAVGLAFPPPDRAPVIDRVERVALASDGVARPAEADGDDVVELVACGRPLPGHEIRIVDDAGLEVAERREGRLQFRGPSATSGYYRNPAKTAALFDGDWLESGDTAYLAAGDVYVTGRVKDIIIRAGRNIYPQELEEAVGDVPGIRKGCVAVFGEPDPESGTERLTILAETRETDPAARDALEAGVAEVVAELLQEPPDRIVLAPPRTVPKTSSGKIRRSAAKDVVRTGAETGRRAVWWQVVRLTLSGLWPRLRRRTRAAASLLYAGWWWAVVGAAAAVAWPAGVLLPGRRLRWAVVGGVARAALALMGVPLRVSGREHVPAGTAVLVSNHSSYLDGAVLAAAIPGALTFTAKRELAGQRVAGPFLRRLGSLFVERFDPRAGTEDTRRAVDAVRRGERLFVFPEGTLLRMPGLLSFHLGAFVVAAETGSPVVPITIRGTRSVLRGSGQWFPRRGPVEVVIAPPIEPDGTDFAAAVRLRDAARATILQACGEPDLAGSEAGAPGG